MYSLSSVDITDTKQYFCCFWLTGWPSLKIYSMCISMNYQSSSLDKAQSLAALSDVNRRSTLCAAESSSVIWERSKTLMISLCFSAFIAETPTDPCTCAHKCEVTHVWTRRLLFHPSQSIFFLDTENIAVALTALWRWHSNAHTHTHTHTHTGTLTMTDSMTGMMNECI